MSSRRCISVGSCFLVGLVNSTACKSHVMTLCHQKETLFLSSKLGSWKIADLRLVTWFRCFLSYENVLRLYILYMLILPILIYMHLYIHTYMYTKHIIHHNLHISYNTYILYTILYICMYSTSIIENHSLNFLQKTAGGSRSRYARTTSLAPGAAGLPSAGSGVAWTVV